MYDKLLKLKEDKKWLYYLLLLPIFVLTMLEIYNKYLVSSGKNIIKDAEKDDKKLEKKQNKAEQAAEYHEEKANKIKKELKNIDKKIDKSWHLNE